MRLIHIVTLLLFCWAAVTGCSNDGPACEDSDCVHPPADTCLDADTLREFDSPGTCDPGTGDCRYEYADRICEHGCSQDRCQAGDPCMGVVCDQPPDNLCFDANTL